MTRTMRTPTPCLINLWYRSTSVSSSMRTLTTSTSRYRCKRHLSVATVPVPRELRRNNVTKRTLVCYLMCRNGREPEFRVSLLLRKSCCRSKVFTGGCQALHFPFYPNNPTLRVFSLLGLLKHVIRPLLLLILSIVVAKLLLVVLRDRLSLAVLRDHACVRRLERPQACMPSLKTAQTVLYN